MSAAVGAWFSFFPVVTVTKTVGFLIQVYNKRIMAVLTSNVRIEYDPPFIMYRNLNCEPRREVPVRHKLVPESEDEDAFMLVEVARKGVMVR